MNKRSLLLLVVVVVFGCSENQRVAKISTNGSGTFDAVKWSPDGNHIAAVFNSYKADEDAKLLIYDEEKNEWNQLSELEKKFITDIDWLSNETIVYEIGGTASLGSLDFYSEIALYNIASGVESRIGRGRSVVSLCVIRTNEQIALVRELMRGGFGITILNARTGLESILYTPHNGEEVDQVACSSDGQSIAFTLAKKNPGTSNRVHVYSLNILGISDTEVTILIGFSDMTIDTISWTKDGDILARVIDNLYQRVAVLVSPDGRQTQLNLQGVDPVLIDPSPTENKMVVTSLGIPGFNSVYVIQSELSVNR